MFKKYIGLRTIKTGIAVCLCVLVIAAIGLESPFYAAIAAIISMDKTIVGSFNTGKNRMIGTLVGAILGLACASIMPENAFVCGLGVILLIALCNIMKVRGSITVGGIVFIAIMVNLDGRSPLIYSGSRIIETFIGITIAIIVNLLIFPYDSIEHLQKKSENLLIDIGLYVNQSITGEKVRRLSKIQGKLITLEKEFNIYKGDVHAKKKQHIVELLDKEITGVKKIYKHLEVLDLLAGDYLVNEGNLKKLNALGFEKDSLMMEIRPSDDIRSSGDKGNIEEHIVYNYHLGRLLDQYIEIKKNEN